MNYVKKKIHEYGKMYEEQLTLGGESSFYISIYFSFSLITMFHFYNREKMV